jgi:hypothetical protein
MTRAGTGVDNGGLRVLHTGGVRDGWEVAADWAE